MKVTLYIDGEHNTVEVKDKIKSVLPDANYMIFHPAENKGKVTEFDRIKKMSVEEMAGLLASIWVDDDDWLKHIGGVFVYDDENSIKEWLETEVETE
jgi:hypothetical protein